MLWYRFCLEFMAFYYGSRKVDVSAEALMPQALLQFAGVPQSQNMQVDFDFDALQDTPMFIKLDVGASAYWSEIASMQTLDNLLQLGQIDIVDYLERIPDGYISKRQELLAKYKAKLAAPPPMPAGPENIEGDVAGMGEEIPVEGGSGNRNLQRAIAQTM